MRVDVCVRKGVYTGVRVRRFQARKPREEQRALILALCLHPPHSIHTHAPTLEQTNMAGLEFGAVPLDQVVGQGVGVGVGAGVGVGVRVGDGGG